MKHTTHPENAFAIHWFRRDLRLEGNLILQETLREYNGRVLCVFSFDKAFLGRADFSWNRFLFFLHTLKHLSEQIEALGGTLIFLDEGPATAFPVLLSRLEKKLGRLPSLITWNRDYEPFALKRDIVVEKLFQEHFGISTRTNHDHLVIEPNEIVRSDPKTPYYQIFTPFKKKWLERFTGAEVRARMLQVKKALLEKPLNFSLCDQESKASGSASFTGKKTLQDYITQASARATVPMPKVGFEQAVKQALFFGNKKLNAYSEARDIPSVTGTSQLSVYFKNGTITVAQVIALLDLKANDPLSEKFLAELIWREFYYHILAHFPYVEQGCFIKKYDGLAWENNEDWFEAWKLGKTGYPIVDAGMNQLRATGWMHNRVRMIVASFLTKDLLIDWKWGERYFMEQLLDGDLAPNNGGWQWAASTGCDPQPYFRIFNPTLQQERFDPDGIYISKWVKESSDPIVDHAEQKKKALALYAKFK